jgi:endonuclease III
LTLFRIRKTMPPKKKDSIEHSGAAQSTTRGIKNQKENDVATETSEPVKKRKSSGSTPAEENVPNKAARRSGRGAAKPSSDKLISFLLSDKAIETCAPQDELEDSKSKRTYTSVVPLSPFEELMSALILSRPISHRLGYRTIRTLLNDPYNYRDPGTLKEAGEKKIWQALDHAKTQHKGKIAAQLEALAKLAIDKFSDSPHDGALSRLRVMNTADMRKALLEVKGVGPTGVDIFLRRIQAEWSHVYPVADDRSRTALDHLGLPQDGNELADLIKSNWANINAKGISGASDAAHRQRFVFVRVVELAVAAELESKTQDVLKAALE